jgi:hypothetical protein
MKEIIIFIVGSMFGVIAGFFMFALASISKKADEEIDKQLKPPGNWCGEELVKMEDSDKFDGFM